MSTNPVSGEHTKHDVTGPASTKPNLKQSTMSKKRNPFDDENESFKELMKDQKPNTMEDVEKTIFGSVQVPRPNPLNIASQDFMPHLAPRLMGQLMPSRPKSKEEKEKEEAQRRGRKLHREDQEEKYKKSEQADDFV